MKKLLLIIIFTLMGHSVQAQTTAAENDLIATGEKGSQLSFKEYLDIVRENHPVAQQAALLEQEAAAEVLKARGGFEPKLYADISEKDFDEKNYYQLIDAGLKLPTWLGIDIKTGYERARGAYLNPQSVTPDAGLVYAGISIPIGQGLFIDQRRADLQKAKIFRESNKARQQAILNDLIYEAGNAYWKWAQASEVEEVIALAVELAVERLRFVERSAALGDKPLVDTLEASLQVQTLHIELQQAELKVMNARAELSNYLWFKGVLPMELSSTVDPEGIESEFSTLGEILPDNVDSLIGQHPEFLQTAFKLDVLNVERRLNREQLKPTLNLDVTPLIEPVGGNGDIRITENNMKWGLTFEMPLLLRKQRAELQKTSLKLKSTNLELERKRLSLNQKLVMATQEWETSRSQSVQFTQTVSDYQRMLNAEQRKFEMGESSLFMVNSRLNKYLDSRIKLIDLQFKNRKSELKTRHALGVLANVLDVYSL